MSDIRYYFDDDSSSARVVRGLIGAGVVVVTSDEAGMRGRSDPEHLAHCLSTGLVLVTANEKDFARLHWSSLAAERRHSGIVILAQQTYSVGERIRRLLKLRTDVTAEQMAGRLEYLSHWGAD